MTEKQFYLNEGEVGILKILDMRDDNENIYLTSSKSDMEMVVELLNELNDENEQLKQQINCHKSRIQLLSPLLDLADAIIDLGDDEKAKAFWEKRNNEVEQEWNEILKGDVE